MNLNIEPTRDERVQRTTRQVGLAGWTMRLRTIDQIAGGEILGIRLTAANKLFEQALSIQIFDRETVTLSFGFMQEDHVSLSGPDGREFLLWMLSTQSHVLTKDLWELLPEKKSEIEPIGAPSFATGKPALVSYLAKNHPEIFGPHGAIASGDPNWPEFYAAVYKLLEFGYGGKDERHNMGVIYELEKIAHQCYRDANQLLRGSDASNFPARDEARAAIRAAERLRQAAGEIRGRMTAPPAPANFPEEILTIDRPPCFIGGKPADDPLHVSLTEPAELAPLNVRQGAKNQQGQWVAIGAGDLVTVSDNQHPWFQRMAKVKEVRADDLLLVSQGNVEQPAGFEQVTVLG